MSGRPSFGVRLRSLLLAALLLVPLFASGHHHAETASSASCAVCIATHHAPANVGPVVADSSVALRFVDAVFAPSLVPLTRAHTPISGRAPPSSLSTFSIS